MTNTKQDERTPGPGRLLAVRRSMDRNLLVRDNPSEIVGETYEEEDAALIVKAVNAYTSTEALREALAPFASAHERFEAGLDDCIAEHFDNSEICDGVTWGDLRRARAALSGSPPPSSRSLGYLYFNPDTGTEFSENHPIESGECDDAENVREATAEALRDELVEAWRANAEMEANHSREIEQFSVSPAPSTEGLREWQPIAGAPRDQNIIVAAMNTYSKTWIVGEAHWQSDDPDHPDDGDWWWANISPGDYTGDSIFNMNGPVEFWQLLPPAPDAARTALAGVTAPQPDIEELIVAAYERGFQWCVENANDPEAAAYVGKAARDYADKTMNAPSAGVTAPQEVAK